MIDMAGPAVEPALRSGAADTPVTGVGRAYLLHALVRLGEAGRWP